MTGRTHMAAGIAVGSVLCADFLHQATDLKTAACIIGFSAFGALLPDIDCASSKLGRKLPPASIAIQFFFGHRTLFHAPLLYITLVLVLLAFPFRLYVIAAGLGALSHIILDTFNRAGIPWLYPIRHRFSLAHIMTGGIIDAILGTICFLSAVLVAILYGSAWLPESIVTIRDHLMEVLAIG